MRWWAAGLLWGVLSLYGPTPSYAEASQPQQAGTTTSQQQPGNQPSGSPTAPFHVQIIPTPKSAEERAQEAQDRHEKATVDWWLMAFTGGLFIATIGLILATGVLGYFAYQQMRDTRESIAQATRSADAAQLSAEAAKSSADLSRIAMVATQRASVSIAQIVRNAVLKSSEEKDLIGWAFGVQWHNRGPTRARGMSGLISVRRFVPDIPDNFDFPYQLTTPVPTMSIDADAKVETGSVFVSIKEIQSVINGDGKLYAWGKATYRDVFEGTDIRTTNFCTQIIPNGKEPLNFESKNPFTFQVYQKNQEAT